MKKLAAALLLTLASTASFANNCSITYIATGSLKDSLDKQGFNLEDKEYQNLCNQLKRNNAGVHFISMSQISPHQTTVLVNIALFSLSNKLNVRTLASNTEMRYNIERTTNTVENDLYKTSMSLLVDLANNQSDLDKMFKQVREIQIFSK